MILGFNGYKHVLKNIPSHKRKPNRLALFYLPVKQLDALFSEFKIFRSLMLKEVNMTGQKLTLERILNERVEGAMVDGSPGISISDFAESGTWLSDSEENLDFIYLGATTEASPDYEEIPGKGEETESYSTDFRVFAPAATNDEEIHNIITLYKLAGKTYEIIKS